MYNKEALIIAFTKLISTQAQHVIMTLVLVKVRMINGFLLVLMQFRILITKRFKKIALEIVKQGSNIQVKALLVYYSMKEKIKKI